MLPGAARHGPRADVPPAQRWSAARGSSRWKRSDQPRKRTWSAIYLVIFADCRSPPGRPARARSRHGTKTVQRGGSIATSTMLRRASARQVATATESWLCHVGPCARPFVSRKSATQAGSNRAQQATNAHRARLPPAGFTGSAGRRPSRRQGGPAPADGDLSTGAPPAQGRRSRPSGLMSLHSGLRSRLTSSPTA